MLSSPVGVNALEQRSPRGRLVPCPSLYSPLFTDSPFGHVLYISATSLFASKYDNCFMTKTHSEVLCVTQFEGNQQKNYRELDENTISLLFNSLLVP